MSLGGELDFVNHTHFGNLTRKILPGKFQKVAVGFVRKWKPNGIMWTIDGKVLHIFQRNMKFPHPTWMFHYSSEIDHEQIWTMSYRYWKIDWNCRGIAAALCTGYLCGYIRICWQCTVTLNLSFVVLLEHWIDSWEVALCS